MLTPLLSLALAGGLDADGDGLPSPDAEGSTGLVRMAPRGAPGSGAVSLGGDVMLGALQRTVDDTDEVLVGTAGYGRANLAAAWTSWLGTTAQLPVRIAASSDGDTGGPALGDARATMWAFTGSERTRVGLGGGLLVPTGAADAFAGGRRWTPSARLSGRHRLPTRVGQLDLRGGLGLHHEGAVDPVQAVGGPNLHAAVGAGFTSVVDVGVSARVSRPLNGEIGVRRGTPAAIAVDVGRRFDQLAASLLVSKSIVSGVGAPSVRVAAHLGWQWGKRTKPLDPPPTERELRITDPDGAPIPAARVTLSDQTELAADAEGRLVVPYRAQGQVEALGLGTLAFRAADVDLQLPWARVPLELRVTTTDGAPVVPAITLDGVPAGPVPTEGEASARWTLPPGSYRIEVDADGYGTQGRTVEIVPGSHEAVPVEVALLPEAGDAQLTVRLADADGRLVSDAELQLDGVSVGTASRGEIVVGGLAERTVSIGVASRTFRTDGAEVDLTGGGEELDLVLGYAPGTVRVTARGLGGPVRDGLLLVDGPRTLPPVDLGPQGDALLQLSEGDWLMALTSPAYGLQQRTIRVDADSPVPLHVAFDLLGQTSANVGVADLWIDVRDLDGRLVDGATILLDGVSVGTTSTGGSIQLESLPAGQVVVEARGPTLEPTSREVELNEGLEVVTLPVSWQAGTVQVTARSQEGPADARVDFAGPAPYAGGNLGPPGRRVFPEVPAGSWEVIASHASGLEAAWTTTSEQAGRRAEVDFYLGHRSGDATLTICTVDPGGAPVVGARLELDHQRLSSTGTDGCVHIEGLAPGGALLGASHPHHGEVTRGIELSNAGRDITLTLPWVPGLVDLDVTGSGLADALVYASGDRVVDPVPLRSDGSQRLRLSPGPWDLVVSGSAGLAQRRVELSDLAAAPMPVAISLGADDRNGAQLHLVDAARRPLEGVDIHVDGASLGRTDASGALFVADPSAGQVSVVDPAFEAIPPFALEAGDDHWVVLAPRPRAVPIRAGHDGRPVSVIVSAKGPSRVEPVTIDGTGELSLSPGSWEIIVDPGEALAAHRAFVTVHRKDTILPVVFDLDEARVRTTATGLELVDVKFEVGEDVASEAYASILEEVAASIISDPDIRRVDVEGHTDPTGGVAYNYELSRRRAASVVAALMERGVPADMLNARGYGPSRPVADNATESGRATNRRVEFRTTTSRVAER